jgi:hypothetical protein
MAPTQLGHTSAIQVLARFGGGAELGAGGARGAAGAGDETCGQWRL